MTQRIPWAPRGWQQLLLAGISVLVWGAVGLLTILFSTLIRLHALVLGWTDPQRRCAHMLASQWGRLTMRCNPVWTVTVIGRERLPADRPSIVVANHQSMWDIMALFFLRHQFKWVAKAELFRGPFVGEAMRAARYVPLARGRHGSIRDTYQQAKQWLADGISVVFFPEGARSRTGQLGPFKSGAFKLALDTGCPIVPIALVGTPALLAPGSWIVRPARVRISILEPIDPSRYRLDEMERLREDVRRAIADALAHGADADAVPTQPCAA